MNENKIKIYHYSISNPDRTRKFVSAFNYEPINENEHGLGNIGFLIEIEHGLVPSAEDLVWSKELSQGILSFIQEKYYREEKSYREIYDKFEHFLQELNKWLEELDLENKTINCIISLLSQNQLHFAQTGNIIAYLYQNKNFIPLIEAKSNYKKNQKFSNIISGAIEPEGQVYFLTNNFFDYLSIEELKKIINKKSEINKNIQKALRPLNQKVSTGILTIQNAPLNQNIIRNPKEEDIQLNPTPPEENKKTNRKKKSIINDQIQIIKKETNNKESKGQIIVADDLLEEKSVATKSVNIVSNVVTTPSPTLKKPSSVHLDDEEKLKNLIANNEPKNIKRAPKKLFLTILRTILSLLGFLCLFLYRIIGLKLIINKIKAWWHELSYLQKVIIILSLIIAILFVQSLIIFGKKEYQKQNDKKYLSLISTIQTKQKELSAAMIYKDEAKIQSLVADIQITLNDLPENFMADNEEYNQIKQDLNQQLEKIYKIKPATNLKTVADLSNNEKMNIGGLGKLNDKLYFFNTNDNFIYQINLGDSKTELINKTSANIGYLQKMTILDKDTLLFTHGNSLATFNIVNKNFNPIELTSNQTELVIKDLIVYSDKLYILDNKNSKIFKYTRTAGGFGKEESWLNESINLQNSNSFAADGSLYVLSGGQILKFYRGSKQEFNLKNIFPALQAPSKIITWLEAKNIYLLDPINTRLIIFNKNGDLIKQITFKELKNPTDFVINDKEDKVWLLNEKKVFELSLK